MKTKGLTDSTGLQKPKGWKTSKLFENFAPFFPKWVTMIDHSERTQCRVSFLELWENNEKGKSCASKTNRSYGNNIAQTATHKFFGKVFDVCRLCLNETQKTTTTAAALPHKYI